MCVTLNEQDIKIIKTVYIMYVNTLVGMSILYLVNGVGLREIVQRKII